MRHVEYPSPAVQYYVERHMNRLPVRRLAWGCPERKHTLDPLLAEMRGIGLLTHDAGDRVIVTAGACDVDRAWLRARESTRVMHSREHAQAIERIADRDAARRLRKAREAARRSSAVEDDELAAFMP